MNFTLEQQNPAKKLSGLAFVALLHVVLVYALATGLIRPPIHFDPPVIDINVEPAKKAKPIEPPPATDIDVKLEKVYQAPTEILPPTITIVDPSGVEVTHLKPDLIVDRSGHGENTAAPIIVPAIVNASACERPDYPSREVREGIEGTTTLAFLIGANGKILESKIEKSSGSKALDKSAIAGLSRCAFKPGTVGGIAQQSWTKIEYVWRLE